MDLNPDLDLRKKLAPGFDLDLDLSSLTGFGFDLDLQGWWICTPLMLESSVAYTSKQIIRTKFVLR